MEPANQNVPLVVDLDGTLIRTDMLWESLARLLRKNPAAIFQILFWWARGRAWLKQKLAARVQIDAATLPYHEKFLAWLRAEKNSGRKIILATASDLKMAQPAADHVGIFDEVLASDGKTNLRSENKLRALTEKFGARGFDYAGNSTADFAVWRGARQAVVVNASRAVLREAANCTQLGPAFCEGYSPFAIAKAVCAELFWRSGYLAAIFAGLLLSAAFPKFSLAGFAWVCPALMAFAARGKNGADAFRTGCVGGFAFWLASLSWLLLIPVAGFPILGWILLSAYCALFTGAWTLLICNFQFPVSNWFSRLRWTLGGAAAWVALEFLRVWLFSGFPWSLLGVSQYKLVPLIQIAAVTGVFGVSFLVAWFSLAIYSAAEMIHLNPAKRHVWQAEIVLPMVTVVLLFVGGIFYVNRDPSAPAENFLRVTCIQPSIPQTVIWDESENEKSFARFLALNETALTNQADLLVWPESAVPEMSAENCRAISTLARAHHVWLILNGEDMTVTRTETNWFNAAFLVNPQGELATTYHKQKLVIFGEYVPLARWLPFLKWFTPITGGWTPGEKPAVFSGDNFSAAPLICFEDCFPATARAASAGAPDFLVNLTNDGWFGERAEQWQHLANSVFRAVENGLPLVRCANNGVTCWIDAHGRVQQFFRTASGDEYGSGALTMKIPLRTDAEKSAPTFYQRHGDWFAFACATATAVSLAFGRRRRR